MVPATAAAGAAITMILHVLVPAAQEVGRFDVLAVGNASAALTDWRRVRDCRAHFGQVELRQGGYSASQRNVFQRGVVVEFLCAFCGAQAQRFEAGVHGRLERAHRRAGISIGVAGGGDGGYSCRGCVAVVFPFP